MKDEIIVVICFENLYLMTNVYLLMPTGKPTFCICENKCADQLCSMISVFVFATRIEKFLIYLYPKFQVSIFYDVTAQPDLCQTWTEIRKTGFLTSGLIY